MQDISNKQRLFLKKMAHHLKPVVMLGQAGLNDNIIAEIQIALDKHELIKVKIAGAEKTEKKTITTSICDQSHATLIHQIGHMAILYKTNKKNAKIVLP